MKTKLQLSSLTIWVIFMLLLYNANIFSNYHLIFAIIFSILIPGAILFSLLLIEYLFYENNKNTPK